MAAMKPLSATELQRRLEELDERQLAQLAEYVRDLPAERKTHLDRIAVHLATRFGSVEQAESGAAYWYRHTDATGKEDGLELRVADRPDLSGFLTFLEWVYVRRRASAQAIERARVWVGPDFNTARQIRAMRDASSGVEDGATREAPTGSVRERR